jgi:hypothetical protein
LSTHRLVADVGDDAVALLLDRRSSAALVGDGRQRRSRWLEGQAVPAGVALGLEVLDRRLAHGLAAAGDEEHRDAVLLGEVEQLEGGAIATPILLTASPCEFGPNASARTTRRARSAVATRPTQGAP